MTDPKKIAFMKAVRQLEIEHGLYIETSEWLSLETRKPGPRDGIFAAADTIVEMAELDAALEPYNPDHSLACGLCDGCLQGMHCELICKS